MLSKLKNLDKISKQVKNYKSYSKVYYKRTIFFRGIVTVLSMFSDKPEQWYQSYLYKKLSKQFSEVIEKYKDCSFDNEKNNSKDVWILWFQGEEQMPLIVKRCYESLKNNLKDYNIHLLSDENYGDYVEIPEHIMDKYRNGNISIIHLSDIVRIKLLKKYGGFWIDATIFTTSDNHLSNKAFYSMKSGKSNAMGKGKWAIYLLGSSKGNKLFSFIDDCFSLYWQNNDYLIDYFLTDYCMMIAYDNIDYFQRIIDEVEYNNPNAGDLFSYLNKPFNKEIYEEIKSKNQFHKLSYKQDLLPERKFLEEIDDKETFYKKIIVDEDF